MCGIAGVIDYQGRAIAEDRLLAARDALMHRGPDDQGIQRYTSDNFTVALVHTRLAVIDTSNAGHQPFADPAGRYPLVYNGEIYNFEDIRKELSDRYSFRTHCDTEALHAAMIHWGDKALARLNGIWAFAFFDLSQRRGWLARDPFGVKPLYYAVESSGRLAFASELRALLPLLSDTSSLRIDSTALHQYLALGFIPHPRTIYEGIRKLPPGCLLEITPQGPREPAVYYRFNPVTDEPCDYEEAGKQLRRRIAAAVRAQRFADVPLGAFLSGGLDSSVVVAELAEAGGPRVRTFAIGYADHPHYDETRYARLVANRFGTEHHEFKLTFNDVLNAMPALHNHLAEPFADASLIPTSLVSFHTRRHVTVALSGDGGDELFAGYWRYLGHYYLQRYRGIPAVFRRWLIEPLLAIAPSAKSGRILNRIRQARKLLRGNHDDPFERHAAWSMLGEREAIASLMNASSEIHLAKDLRDARDSVAPDANESDPLAALLYADLRFSLPADMLFKVDAASMLHALEVRVPLLDRAVAEFAAPLPSRYKINRTHRKRLLRDAYRDILPAEILDRPKMGFEVPIGEFFRGPLREAYQDIVSANTLADLGLNLQSAVATWNEHQSRRQENADILYALFVLCSWKRNSRPANIQKPE